MNNLTKKRYNTRKEMETVLITNDNYILLAQDKDVNVGSKYFYNYHIDELNELANTIKATNHNLYEILPPNYPVKPYFDLEMVFPEINYEEIGTDAMNEIFYDKINLFLNYLAEEIKTLFGVQLLLDDFLVLSSCRKNKLSFHVVIQNKIYFDNVAEHKKFVQYLWNRFCSPKNENEKKIVEQLTYFTEKGEQRYIFDKIPYGSYQNFRLINQSKKGGEYRLQNLSVTVYPEYGINQIYTEGETLIRLYNGPGERMLLDMNTAKFSHIVVKPSKRVFSKTDASNTTLADSMANMSLIDNNSDIISNKDDIDENIEEIETYVEFPYPLPDLNTHGITLQKYHNLTFQDLDKLPEYKRYLYLIPNTAQSWDMYLNVGFAIRAAGGTLQDYKEWAKLSPKYNEYDGEFNCFDTFRKEDDGRTFTVRFLKRLATMANSMYFERKKSDYVLLFGEEPKYFKQPEKLCAPPKLPTTIKKKIVKLVKKVSPKSNSTISVSVTTPS